MGGFDCDPTESTGQFGEYRRHVEGEVLHLFCSSWIYLNFLVSHVEILTFFGFVPSYLMFLYSTINVSFLLPLFSFFAEFYVWVHLFK